MVELDDEPNEPIRIDERDAGGSLFVCASSAGGRIRGLRLPA
jgi:hypothetical protein